MLRLIKFTVVLGMLALAGLVGWLYTKRGLDSYFNRGTVVAPSIVGKTIEQAIESAKLPVRIASRAASNEVPAGRILTQDPVAGTPVRAGRAIMVVLSQGPDLMQVPDLVGRPLRKAKLILSGARLSLGQLCGITGQAARDEVLAQYPEAGSQLGRGGNVDVLISSGRSAGPGAMPRLTGLDETRAREVLARLGFERVDTLEKPAPGPAHDGLLLDQSPMPGISVRPDARVLLTVARANMERSAPLKRFTVEFTMPPGLTPKQLDIYESEDRQNRRLVYSESHQPGEPVRIPIQGSGLIELEFYVDNIAYGRERF